MSDELVCTSCGHIGDSKTVTKGHFFLEVVLWLCFLVPGFIYSIWRHTSRYEACPVCGNAHLLPISSPMAQKFLRDNMLDKLQNVEESFKPSPRAQSIGFMIGSLVRKIRG